MNQIKLGPDGLLVPPIALGCMRMAEMEPAYVPGLIGAAMESGLNFFDHADIYGDGRSEELFAAGMASAGIEREEVILQSKCGIRDGMFDFSEEHILDSVDGILKRLETDYLDVLLLHRPDALMEPEEVARAFSKLKGSGKVKHFGVSNQNPGQVELLRRVLPMPLAANQLQLSLAFTGMIDAGFHVNMTDGGSTVRDGGILEYCRIHDIAIQPWSPFQYGFFEGVFIGSERYPELNSALDRLSGESGLSPTALAVAWLLRIPGSVQPVVGTTNAERLRDIATAGDYTMSREDWYALYRAAGNILP